MGSNNSHTCPVSDCSKTGSLSQIITHISTSDDSAHSWEALGYEHSYNYRTAEEKGQSADDSTPSGTDSAPRKESKTTDDPIPLEAVSGIGDSRSNALRNDGYETASDVAAAGVEELTAVPLITYSTAKTIRTAAREECGYSGTTIAEWAEDLDVPREEVAEAYGSLAGASVPPDKAERSVRFSLTEDEQYTIFDLSDYSLQYRHFLFQAGFETIEDVAEATVAELTEAKYVGEALAENLKSLALERRADDKSENAESDKSQTSPDEGTPTPTAKSGTRSVSVTDHQGAEPETNEPERVPVEGIGKFPAAMQNLDQWLLWKQTEDGLKVPRAPWETREPLRFVDGTDPANWTSFEDAVEWMDKIPHDLELAFSLSRKDDVVFLDLDDVVENGEIASEAQELIHKGDTYSTYSTSGTGVHLFGNGEISTDVKSITGSLSESADHTIEVYDRNRFVAMTGDHIEYTPGELTDIDSLVTELEDEFVSVSESTPDKATAKPRKSREELQSLETTNDLQDLFDAISQTRPDDIWMKSTQTREHGDGTYSYDPSWVHSESGTRLAVTDDGWIYRKGMFALDALQLVALEENIITKPDDYPEGKDFWDAVQALRDRGAHIPTFEPPSGAQSSETAEEIDKREIATILNYGDPVRTDVHRYDRDYMETLALKLTPKLIDSIHGLDLSPATAYRAAEIYIAGHSAGIVPGSSHATTLAAAIRIAAVENDEPRPWEDIKEVLDISNASVRNKYERLQRETNLTAELDPQDFIIRPQDYLPYLTEKLDITDEGVLDQTETALEAAQNTGGTSPLSEAGAALYAIITELQEPNFTQEEIASAANVSEVTIRNNYQKYLG